MYITPSFASYKFVLEESPEANATPSIVMPLTVAKASSEEPARPVTFANLLPLVPEPHVPASSPTVIKNKLLLYWLGIRGEGV